MLWHAHLTHKLGPDTLNCYLYCVAHVHIIWSTHVNLASGPCYDAGQRVSLACVSTADLQFCPVYVSGYKYYEKLNNKVKSSDNCSYHMSFLYTHTHTQKDWFVRICLTSSVCEVGSHISVWSWVPKHTNLDTCQTRWSTCAVTSVRVCALLLAAGEKVPSRSSSINCMTLATNHWLCQPKPLTCFFPFNGWTVSVNNFYYGLILLIDLSANCDLQILARTQKLVWMGEDQQHTLPSTVWKILLKQSWDEAKGTGFA